MRQFKKPEPGYIYIISDGEQFKVGVSFDPDKRLRTMQTGNRRKLTLEHIELKNEPYKVEKVVHRQLQKYRTNGEWFEGCSLNDIRIQLLLCTEYD